MAAEQVKGGKYHQEEEEETFHLARAPSSLQDNSRGYHKSDKLDYWVQSAYLEGSTLGEDASASLDGRLESTILDFASRAYSG